MLKVNLIIGEPASGKSTYMRGILSGSEPHTQLPPSLEYKLLRAHYSLDSKSIVMGVYDEQLFSGTDRLSKAAGPKFREWVSKLAENPQYSDWTIWAEGERFTNNPTITHLRDDDNIDFTLYVKKVPQDILDARRSERGTDNQNEKFLKGMKTRIDNLIKKYDHEIL